MADAKKKAESAAAKGAKPKKRGKVGFYTTVLVAICAAPFMFPTLVLLMVGLLPTLVALFVDKDREHSSAYAIGAMNCAGVAPFLIDLLIKGQSMENTFHILGDPNTWLVILGSAAIGQMIVSVIPQALTTLTFAHSETRVKTLKKNLDTLRENWGPDVGTTKPLDQLTRMD